MTAMTNSNSLSVKDILNLQRSDRLCCYGVNRQTRDHVEQLRSSCNVVAIGLDKIELEEGRRFSSLSYTYDGLKEAREDEGNFDKVFCYYPALSNSHRSPKHVLDNCYRLCKRGGMGFIAGLSNEKDVQDFQQRHYVDVWSLAKTSGVFNLLFKKNCF